MGQFSTAEGGSNFSCQMHQLHISEKTGRGVPVVTSKYSEKAYAFEGDGILVTIPFNCIHEVGDKVGDKVGDNKLNASQVKVLAEIRNNPNITKPELAIACDLGKTSIDNIVSILKKNGYIERIESNKKGYWKVNG